MKRKLALALTAVTATTMIATAAVAAPNDNDNDQSVLNGKAKGHDKGNGKGKVPAGRTVDIQLLHLADFHGHLEPVGEYGGAANLAGLADELAAEFDGPTYRVASGDSIGGSTFVSGLFQDEPTIEVLNALGLDASSVGNHEFDEGVDELLRIQHGGNHPELGQFGDTPYAGAEFPYLAANVVWKDSGEPILPATYVEKYRGATVGFIGVVTSDTPILVSPGGIKAVDFLDEAETINKYAAELQSQGVESIFVMMHEGAYDHGLYPDEITHEDLNAGCQDLSGPAVEINADVTPAVDGLLTGHTHNAYSCLLPDPDGNLRAFTGSGDWGRGLSQLQFEVDRKTKDVVRDSFMVDNHVVHADGSIDADEEVAAIVDEWVALAEVAAGQVVGSVTEDITGDASQNRGIETPMGNLIADSILWGTQDAGAQISFMNIGGVRASLLYDQISNNEQPGEITYQEAYNVMPFGNLLVTVDMTGAQIEAVLNQQYDPDRSRQMLALSPSEGFSYTWDAQARQVEPGSMTLNGAPIDADATYRVSTLNFLAEGGDAFTVFTEGTNLTGGPEDLANVVNYLRENSPLSAPEDRVNGL